jgi:AbrB family looped-hinge helix DNA binding protein
VSETTVGRAFSGIRGRSKWVEPGYNAIMATHLTIDKAGRVVIPKSLREELRLEPGDSLEMETAGEAITLRPVRGSGQLRKEHGVWVFFNTAIDGF